MKEQALQLAAAGLTKTSTGESFQFYVLGIVAILGALGMVFSKKAVHSALSLAVTMICLAIFYLAQGAYFLGVVQIVVYTGAVMMLFLFVLMLVGVSSSDSLTETIKGQRAMAVVAGLAFGVFVLVALGHAHLGTFKGAGVANDTGGGNVQGIALVIFQNYFWAFEVTSALLITAAVGAMVLTHRERIAPKKSQREMAEDKLKQGLRLTPLPTPGVYARHNAVDVPALLPDGTVSEDSVNKTLQARAPIRDAVGLTLVTHKALTVPRQGDAPELESAENRTENGGAEQ